MDEEKNRTFWQHCICKVFSGRFAMTIICGISFVLIVNCLTQILREKATEMTISDLTNIYNMLIIIISNVITFYFTREKSSTPEQQEPISKKCCKKS